MSKLLWPLTILLTLLTPPLAAQEAIPFDDVPAGIVFEGASPIRLNGDVAAMGEVSTTVGVRFPDGSLQETASGDSGVAQSTSANAGLYGNRIVDMVPLRPYTEVCIKDGALYSDIHSGLQTTAGGNCVPGDIGWIIERLERDSGTTESWSAARLNCLKDGLRLPEAFEWQISCDNAGLFGISHMTDDWEWAANTAHPDVEGPTVYAASLIFGNGSCDFAAYGSIGRSDGIRSSNVYRCAR